MNSCINKFGVFLVISTLAALGTSRFLPGSDEEQRVIQLQEILPVLIPELIQMEKQRFGSRHIEDPIEEARELLAASDFMPVKDNIKPDRYEPSANDMLRVRRVPGSEFLGKRSGYNPKQQFPRLSLPQGQMTANDRSRIGKRVPGSEFLGR